MKKIFMTGSRGFIGSKLCMSLKDRYEIIEFSGDLRSFSEVSAFLGEISASDTLIHLAGMSSPADCDKNPRNAYEINVGGTAILAESLTRLSKHPHLIFASTAHVYAQASDDRPLTEESAIGPINCYGRTKRAAEVFLLDWARYNSQFLTILRLFNHTHKSQSANFFLPKLYSHAIKAKATGEYKTTCQVGDLELFRDIGSLQDLSRAIESVVELKPLASFNPEIFNVCSGVAKNLRTLGQGIFERLGIHCDFETVEAFVRAEEPKIIVGDSRALQGRSKWIPTCRSPESLLSQFFDDLT